VRTIVESDSDFFCDIQAPCFRSLNEEEADIVRASRTQVQFRKGENLTKQGAFASYVLFMVTGIARQYVEGEGGRDFNLRIIIPGEFVGLSAVFSGNLFTYSAVALADCQAYLIEKEAISKVLKHNPQFTYSIIKRYCDHNTSLMNTVSSVVFKQMNGRMAEALLYIDNLRTADDSVFIHLSRKELADFAGISMESAVKLLKSFEKDGLIKLQDKDIRILSREKLAEISRRG